MKQLQKDIRTILNCVNTESFEERKSYNRLLDFIQLDSIYRGIPVEDSCDNEKKGEIDRMNKKEVCEVCANISLKRMYLILLKAQEIILDNNPQYHKEEILDYLTSIEHDILMLNDKDNCVDRDLFE